MRYTAVRLSLRVATAAAAFAMTALAGLPARAQACGELADLKLFGWSLSNVRVGMRVGPDYMGSNDYRVQPSGSLTIYRRADEPSYGAPDDGVSVALGGHNLSAGLTSRWRSSRDDKNDLRGFDKIDWTIEAGGYVNWWPADWIRTRMEVRYGFGGHDSWVADLGADLIKRKRRWVVSAGPRLSWADKSFTRLYFGVTPAEASRSPLGVTAFTPDEDTVTIGAIANAEYQFSPRWSVVAFANYRRLTGDAADSPIVADLGSKDQFSATLGVRYWFGK